jgi:O-acetylhomoserine (thiol)-lyase
VKLVDATNPENIRAAISEKTRFIFTESLANPGGIVMDLEAIAKIAADAKLPYVVDNTLASPYLIRPIEWGANIVVHSLTKFIGGHGNALGGVIVDGGNFDWKASGKFPALTQPSGSYHGMVLNDVFGPMGIPFAIACRVLGLRDLGAAISPFNAFLILTGAETLHLRMQRHSDNTLAVARWLKAHPKVSWVSYAGLESDPYHALASKYAPKGAGAVLTFGLKGGYEAGVKFVNSLKLVSHLANIGDVRSLAIHPASTTHSQLPDEGKIAAGAGPDVVRLSIGIEDVADITADLDQALNA